MPVAISFPDPVNSAAQFLDGVAKGSAASSATSQAADANNSTATLVSKDRKTSDEDFDAVLAMLLNGGIPPLQAPALPVSVKVPEPVSVSVKMDSNAAETGTSNALDTATANSGTDANAVVESSVGGVGQMLLRGRDSGTGVNAVGESSIGRVEQMLLGGKDSAPQQLTASLSLASAKVAASLSGKTSTSETAESANVNGLNLSNTTPTTFSSTVETAAKAQKGQGGVSSQVTSDVNASTTQVLPIVGADKNVDAAATTVNITVLSEPPAVVSAKPLSKEIMQALERIGRPPESKVVADEILQPTTAAVKVTTSTTQNLGSTSGETQASAGSILALNSMSAVVSTTPTTIALKTATTTSSEPSTKGTTDQQVTQSSDPKTFVTGLEVSPPSTAKLIRSSSSKTVEAKTGVTATLEPFKSIPDNAASTTDLMTTANEQFQRSKESSKQDALSDTDSPASGRPKSQASSKSDLTAGAIQSGLTSSASPNSVPDLAASISADMRQPLTSQVSRSIMDHVERNGVRQSDSLSVRLDPPELGEMTIQLSKTHEGLAVRVTAREAVTMDMLFARGQEIESQLRGQHINFKSLEFQRADMSDSGFSHGQGQGQPQQQNNASRRSANLLNQILGGTRGLSPISNSHPRSATSDSNYGLSFRA